MLLGEERTSIVEYGRRLKHQNPVRGTGGNLSIYNRSRGLLAVSPSSRDYDDITPEDVIVARLDGTVVEGAGRPSTELRMHSLLYERRDDIHAVVHAHTPSASALSCMRRDLPPIYYLTMAAGPRVRCAPYALAGSAELAENAFRAMEGNYAALLSNHGLIAGGPTLAYAWYLVEEVDFAADLYLRTLPAGGPVPLSEAEAEQMVQRLAAFRPKGPEGT